MGPVEFDVLDDERWTMDGGRWGVGRRSPDLQPIRIV